MQNGVTASGGGCNGETPIARWNPYFSIGRAGRGHRKWQRVNPEVDPEVCFKCREGRFFSCVLCKSCTSFSSFLQAPVRESPWLPVQGQSPTHMVGFLSISWFAVLPVTDSTQVNDVQRNHCRNKRTAPSPGISWSLQFAQPVFALVRKYRKLKAAKTFHSAWSWPYLECWVWESQKIPCIKKGENSTRDLQGYKCQILLCLFWPAIPIAEGLPYFKLTLADILLNFLWILVAASSPPRPVCW